MLNQTIDSFADTCKEIVGEIKSSVSKYETHGEPAKSTPSIQKSITTCASLALLHPLLSLTHWIFRSLMLPYKSSSHSAKCVRCASLRSGGRRLVVREMIECHISAQPRTPFCHYVAFPLKGKREIWREKQGVIYFRYHSGVSPFGGWRHHLSPSSRGHYGCLAMEPCLCRKA